MGTRMGIFCWEGGEVHRERGCRSEGEAVEMSICAEFSTMETH